MVLNKLFFSAGSKVTPLPRPFRGLPSRDWRSHGRSSSSVIFRPPGMRSAETREAESMWAYDAAERGEENGMCEERRRGSSIGFNGYEMEGEVVAFKHSTPSPAPSHPETKADATHGQMRHDSDRDL
jgi:hypothetical protein